MNPTFLRCPNPKCANPGKVRVMPVSEGSRLERWRCAACDTAYRITVSANAPLEVAKELPSGEWVSVGGPGLATVRARTAKRLSTIVALFLSTPIRVPSLSLQQ